MQKILFNDKYGLTYEVLSGRKTQTRRIIPEASLLRAEAFKEKYFDDTLDVLDGKELLEQFFLIDEVEKPQYHKGEVVAIAQSYKTIYTVMSNRPAEEFREPAIRIKNLDSLIQTARSSHVCEVLKNQDNTEIIFERKGTETVKVKKLPNVFGKMLKDEDVKKMVLDTYIEAMHSSKENSHGWDNKMFVRADFMPHQIRITGIRIQRLQDISDEDCLKEGISLWTEAEDYIDSRIKKSVDELIAAGITPYQIPKCWGSYDSPRAAYAALIDKVSGKGTWERNPWVFVYDFEHV